MVREPTRRQRHVQNILVFVYNESIIQTLAVVPGTRGHDIVVFNINLKPKKKSYPDRKCLLGKKLTLIG